MLVTPKMWWVGKNKTFVFINIFFCDSWVGNHQFQTQSQSYFASNIVFLLLLCCWFCSLYRGVWLSALIAKGPDALPQGVLHSMHELIGERIKRKKKGSQTSERRGLRPATTLQDKHYSVRWKLCKWENSLRYIHIFIYFGRLKANHLDRRGWYQRRCVLPSQQMLGLPTKRKQKAEKRQRNKQQV